MAMPSDKGADISRRLSATSAPCERGRQAEEGDGFGLPSAFCLVPVPAIYMVGARFNLNLQAVLSIYYYCADDLNLTRGLFSLAVVIKHAAVLMDFWCI